MYRIPLRQYVDNDLLYLTLWSTYGLPLDYGLHVDVISFDPDTFKVESVVTDRKRGILARRVASTGDDFHEHTLRIFHKYAFIDATDVAGNQAMWGRIRDNYPADRLARVQRLQFKARHCTSADTIHIAEMIQASKNVRQLHVGLQVDSGVGLPLGASLLASTLQSLLSTAKLDVLRWSSTFLDIAGFFHECKLRRLIWDTPRVYTDTACGVAFPHLESLDITLAPTTLDDPSNVLQWLLGASLHQLGTLTVRSTTAFPHLDAFLAKFGANITRLRLSQHHFSDSAPCGPLDFMARLNTLSLHVCTAHVVLEKGLPSLQTLLLEGLNDMTLDFRSFRQYALRRLQHLVDILANPAMFPSLTVVKVTGVTEDMFTRTEWYPIEEVRLAYCFNKLMGMKKRKRGERRPKRIGFVTEDDRLLRPRQGLKILTRGSYSYGYPIAGVM